MNGTHAPQAYDRDKLVELFGDDPATLAEVEREFLDTARVAEREIKETDEFIAIARAAHRLKGASGMIGAASLRQIARQAGILLWMVHQLLPEVKNLAQQICRARHHPAEVVSRLLKFARKSRGCQRLHRASADPSAQRGVRLLLQCLDWQPGRREHAQRPQVAQIALEPGELVAQL